MITAAVEWGPVATWAGAIATMLVVITTALVALGFLLTSAVRVSASRSRPPNLSVAGGRLKREGKALWVRIGVENRGRGPAMGCVGRLISVATDGQLRRDVDPVQLRWAGRPALPGVDPMHVRRDQHEYLNVLCLLDGSRWQLVTFEEPDFDPGFATELLPSTNVTWYRSRSSPTTRNRSQGLWSPKHAPRAKS